MLLGIITGIFITRILGAEGRGAYAIFQSDIDLFILLLSFSINSAIVYYIANNKLEISRLMGIGVCFVILGTLLFIGILTSAWAFFDGSFIFPTGYNSPFYVVYLIIAFFLSISNAFISALFQGKAMFRVINILSLCNSIFNIVIFSCLYVYMYFGDDKSLSSPLHLEEVLALALIVLSLNSLVWLYFMARYIGFKISFRLSYSEHIKPLLAFTIIIYLSQLINFMNYRLDLWVVEYYKGSYELGYYSLAVNVAQMFWLLSNPIQYVLIPYLVKRDEKDMESFVFLSKLNFTLVILAMIASVLVAHIIFPLVYGAEFTHSVQPFYLLLPGILFACLTKVFSAYIFAMNKLSYNLIATIVGLAFALALDFLLIPRLGIAGASIATTFTYFAILACTIYFLFVKMKFPSRNYYLLTVKDLSGMRGKLKILLQGQKTKKEEKVMIEIDN